MANFDYILFDLDGTILNTNKVIFSSYKYTLMKHLGLEVSDDELIPYFGEQLLTTLKRFSEEHAESMIETYISHNHTIHDELTTPFKGMDLALPYLKSKGRTLALVTSKRREMAIRGLELFDLAKHFTVIIGAEDTKAHKPDPEPILKALELLGAPKDRTIMIGDTPFDIQSAKAAGVASCAVEWSMMAREVLESHKPDYIIDSMEELYGIIG